jgi:hypothetical protein
LSPWPIRKTILCLIYSIGKAYFAFR